MKTSYSFGVLCVVSVLTASAAWAAEPAAPASPDALRALLLESKEKNRGVTIHANGSSIGMVVIAVDEQYIIGRSQQASRIVIRMDRVDGVSAMF